MKTLLGAFTDHPATLGETYLSHFRHAAGFASVLLASGLACFTHALVPALFKTTASRSVAHLHARLSTRSVVLDDYSI